MTDFSSAPATLDPLAARRGGSLSIARMTESTKLTPSQLEDRAIIHRSGLARPEVDAFREIRTRLLAMFNGDNFTVLVAPVSRGSGGSFVARNLAAAMALDEAKSALLIDCDLRQPSQHETMRIDPTEGGLIDLLEDPEHPVADVLYQTGVPRLRLIPAGSSREMASEYFTSFRMALLLDSLRSRYPDRYLFLDGPPASGSPDARILAGLADVTVLVAGYGHDTAAAVAQAAASFDPNKFAGVVFNEGI